MLLAAVTPADRGGKETNNLVRGRERQRREGERNRDRTPGRGRLSVHRVCSVCETHICIYI